jgi:hypothetical protein
LSAHSYERLRRVKKPMLCDGIASDERWSDGENCQSGFWCDAEWRVTGPSARELNKMMTVELGAASACDAIECFPVVVDEVDA